MEAEKLIEKLCRRHGTDPSHGARLLPLVRWALQAPDMVRSRIMEAVEGTLRRSVAPRAADNVILIAVARVLHTWSPNTGILDLDGSADC